MVPKCGFTCNWKAFLIGCWLFGCMLANVDISNTNTINRKRCKSSLENIKCKTYILQSEFIKRRDCKSCSEIKTYVALHIKN